MFLMRLVSLLAVAAVLGGCAHPITINPDLSQLDRSAIGPHLDKSVGYFISQQQRELKVTTPGGGGDSASYFPYRDIETGLYQMLSNVFREVRVLSATDDTQAINQYAIDYVIEPTITTESSSSNVLFWPPMVFSVNLTCKIQDAEGKEITSPTVTGKGSASAGEVLSNFGQAGQRAAEDALLRMQRTMLELPELQQ